MRTQNFNSILVVGIGLIGGSILKNISEKKFKGHLYGLDLNEEVINEAFELGLIENNDKNIQRIEEDCLVVLSVPSLSFAKAINTVKKSISLQKVVFTDTLSAKSTVLAYLESDPDLSRKFILSHPIAGSEKSGLANSTPSLFKNKLVIVSPQKSNQVLDLEKVQIFWKELGSNVVLLDPKRHDSIFAKTSHLPHAIAYALMDFLFNNLDRDTFNYSGGSLEDYTRIASSNSIMWKDIMLSNKDELLKAIDGFKISLDKLSDLIEIGDPEAIKEFLDFVKQARDNLINQKD